MRATETLRTALKAIVEEEGLPWPTKTVIEPPDRKSTRLNCSHTDISRMPSSD